MASRRPESTMPSTGATTAPTTGMNPVRPTPIDGDQAEADEGEPSRAPSARSPVPCSGTVPPSSSSTARQMRS